MLDGNFSMKTWFAQLEMNIQTTELTNSKKKKILFSLYNVCPAFFPFNLVLVILLQECFSQPFPIFSTKSSTLDEKLKMNWGEKLCSFVEKHRMTLPTFRCILSHHIWL